MRLEEKGGRMLMRKALDLNKDQSYMLYMMKQEELRHTYFRVLYAENLMGEGGICHALEPRDSIRRMEEIVVKVI